MFIELEEPVAQERAGLSISLCDIDERPYLKDIEKLVNKKD